MLTWLLALRSLASAEAVLRFSEPEELFGVPEDHLDRSTLSTFEASVQRVRESQEATVLQARQMTDGFRPREALEDLTAALDSLEFRSEALAQISS